MQNRKPKMQKVPAREAQQKHGTGISNNLDRFTTEKPFSQDEANSGSKMVEELMIRTTDHEANFELNPANLFIGDERTGTASSKLFFCNR